MAKTIMVEGQLSTVLDMRETEILISLLDDLSYLKMKNQLFVMDEEKALIDSLKATPSHGVTHRNT